MKSYYQSAKSRRVRKVRSKIFGDATRPRVTVFRSNKHIYAQAINDRDSKTIVSSSSLNLSVKGTKTEIATKVGEEIAKKMLEKGLKSGVFDRGSYKYHGRIMKLAEGVKKQGVKI